jgi:HK97 gp10 family phage protein
VADIFKDFDDLAKKFDDLAYHVQRKVLVKAAKAGAAVIRDEAERLAPKRTGALAKSEMITIAGTGSDSSEVIVKIGPDKAHFYGLFQEFGTAHQPAHPFLEPALESQSEAAIDAALEVLAEEIDKVNG